MSYRISKYIVEDPEGAASLHVETLNNFAETQLSNQDITRAYRDFHPFMTFEGQFSWFNDISDPYNVDTVTSNIIKYWKKIGGVGSFDNLSRTVDVIVAGEFHRRLKDLQDECAEYFRKIPAPEHGHESEAQVRAATKYMASYNYIDCLQMLKAIRDQGS